MCLLRLKIMPSMVQASSRIEGGMPDEKTHSRGWCVCGGGGMVFPYVSLCSLIRTVGALAL